MRKMAAAALLAAALAICASSAPASKLVRFSVKAFPLGATLSLEGRTLEPVKIDIAVATYLVAPGMREFNLSSPGFVSQQLKVNVRDGAIVEAKLEREGSALRLLRSIRCGPSPKSLLFSRDGRRLFAALLGGQGADVFDAMSGEKVGELKPPEAYARQAGFVEMALRPGTNEIWLSQMTSGSVHIFDSETLSYKSTASCKGSWSKVVLFDSSGSTCYVSNWLSKDIAVIDAETRSVKRLIKTSGVPRGMVLSADESVMWVALFEPATEGSVIDTIDLAAGKRIETANLMPRYGAMRHLVRNSDANIIYASEMAKHKVLALNADDLSIRWMAPTWFDPNTIALSPDGRYIFASTRGPNGPDGYLKKGLFNGMYHVIDAITGLCVDWQWGGNQPTGLAVSPDGGLVAFSDFLDNKIQLYVWRPSA